MTLVIQVWGKTKEEINKALTNAKKAIDTLYESEGKKANLLSLSERFEFDFYRATYESMADFQDKISS